jgi:DUF1680 family protein
MRKLVFVILFLQFMAIGLVVAQNKSGDYAINGVAFNHVSLNDQFWLPKIEINRTATIPTSFKKCEETGRVNNFVMAANKQGKFSTTFPFDDTDIYKIIEGASFSMSVHPDAALDKYVDSLIAIVAKAQEPDGYLYTARTIDPLHPHDWSGSERWVKEPDLSHEVYNSGHLFEAAAAHYLATGKRNFLNIALKNADLLVSVFGPGKRNEAPGHEIVEMGLVRLYRITNEKKYLDLAQYFINCRGKVIDPRRAYWQDDKPVVQQDVAEGHAVRAAYLYSGVADVAALTGNQDYLMAIDKIWDDMVSKKFYITGGIGSEHDGERFGEPYSLPNLTSYNETCAAIANVYWNYRMFLLHGDSKYIDVLERSLYNNVISGVSLSGTEFFYPNPLSCDLHFKFNRGSMTRQPWFDCSCCPTNLCRFLPSVPGYIYAQTQNGLYINLFIHSNANLNINNNLVEIAQKTQYPWDGAVKININPAKKGQFAVYLRVPGWAQNKPVPSNLYAYLTPSNEKITISVNGKPVKYAVKNGYAVIDREWKKGDVVDYNLPMKIQQVVANEKVKDDLNRVAIERGPIVYCVEAADNKANVLDFEISEKAKLTASFKPELLNGVTTIQGEVFVKDSVSNKKLKHAFTAIPYYTWNNRGANTMNVWMLRSDVLQNKK